MKKNFMKIMAAAMLAAVTLAGCAKSELVCDAANGKDVVITATRAAKDDFVVTGSLEVAEGETVTVKPALDKGAITSELIASPEEQSIDELPATDGEAAFRFEVSGTEEQTAAAAAGDYMIRITVTEKATGTIHLIAE
ncbi:MAG: hypothetical protein IJH44_01895 [Solobacterium sp.]|nr:hypothetical protein [Solobacterium sp.]